MNSRFIATSAAAPMGAVAFAHASAQMVLVTLRASNAHSPGEGDAASP